MILVIIINFGGLKLGLRLMDTCPKPPLLVQETELTALESFVFKYAEFTSESRKYFHMLEQFHGIKALQYFTTFYV